MPRRPRAGPRPRARRDRRRARPRRARNCSSAVCRAASERTSDSWVWAAWSSARKTSSLLTRPDLEPRLGGGLQALAALEALARDPHELPLRDHAVEGRRHLHGQPLPRQLELPLLAHAGRAGCCAGRSRSRWARSREEGLGQDEAQVARVRQLGHRQVAVAQGHEGAHRAARPGQPLGGVHEDARVVGVHEVAGREARVPERARGRLADLRPRRPRPRSSGGRSWPRARGRRRPRGRWWGLPGVAPTGTSSAPSGLPQGVADPALSLTWRKLLAFRGFGDRAGAPGPGQARGEEHEEKGGEGAAA